MDAKLLILNKIPHSRDIAVTPSDKNIIYLLECVLDSVNKNVYAFDSRNFDSEQSIAIVLKDCNELLKTKGWMVRLKKFLIISERNDFSKLSSFEIVKL